jgi:pimeloyl-ACP methyl ester carboxylesterase
MRARTPIAMLIAAAFAACGSADESPIRRTSAPDVALGPLTRTPIRFASTFNGKMVEAEEGKLRVSERHAQHGGREITVHFVRFASTAKSPGPPIVYLAGGPGGSGTWSAAGDRFPLFQRMREVADVIAYDQRGTWGTEPYMVCPGSWSYPLDRPLDEPTLTRVMRPFLDECWKHWADRADLSAYNTVESVEDLEALRRALGAEKLTLWGISYGTHLALAYIRTHPDRVHRAILAGVEGPDHTHKLPARIDDVVQRVAREVRADAKANRLLPDFIGSLKQTLERLEREPVTIEASHPETKKKHAVTVGADDLRDAVYSMLGEREEIMGLLERGLPVLNGDYRELAAFALRARTEQRALVMSLSMDCASGATPARRSSIEEQGRQALLGDGANASLRATCAGWPIDDLGDEYRSPVRADVPVLFISGTLDVKTPPENAEDVLAGFPNGHHLIIGGASHDDDLFLSSSKIGDAMLGFLRGEELASSIELPPLRFRIP